MVQMIDGKPVTVPDDDRITPEMKSLRTGMNNFLKWITDDGPEVRALHRKFLEGRMSAEHGLRWFTDDK